MCHTIFLWHLFSLKRLNNFSNVSKFAIVCARSLVKRLNIKSYLRCIPKLIKETINILSNPLENIYQRCWTSPEYFLRILMRVWLVYENYIRFHQTYVSENVGGKS